MEALGRTLRRQRYVPVGSYEYTWVLISEACLKQNIDCNENDKRNTSLGSTPSRPHTRSQTGIVLKRRIPDDAALYAEPNRQTTTGRKKQKKSVTDKRVDTRQSSSSSSPKPPVTRHPSLGSASTTSRDLSAPLITLWDASPASGDQHDLEARFPRSRATLPTPIPHLTKKSRGRRVPTQQSSRAATDQKETRLYVCQVEGCAKCFHRGEHLKRHIRSIHTHEKRELSRIICHTLIHSPLNSSLSMHISSVRKVF